MPTMVLSLAFVLFVGLLANVSCSKSSIGIRIYSNLAEIISPLEALPLEFTDEEWNYIRSDSITLLADDLNITSQVIMEQRKNLDGTGVYVRSPMSSDKSGVKFIKATLVDEQQRLVKINDESLTDQDLYLTVPPENIMYLERPPKSKFYVNFTYVTSDANVIVSYLRSGVSWKTQYQLNLNQNNSELIVMANIMNDGKSALTIEKGELIGGDVNLRMPRSHETGQMHAEFDLPIRSNFIAESAENGPVFKTGSTGPTVGQGKELVGLYVFLIDTPFLLESKSNHLIPMFNPRATVERYGLISKVFSTTGGIGKPQRSYRLRSDRYLSRGNCILREQHRIVGETIIPDLATRDKFEFSIGQDTDIIYRENVTLISSTSFNETQSMLQTQPSDVETKLVILTRTRSFYEIHIQVTNFKARPVKIEYEQTAPHFYHGYELVESHDSLCVQDGAAIKFNMTVEANSDKVYSYIVRTVV